MQLPCPHCNRVLDFTGDRPTFCGFCGQRLVATSIESTVAEETKAAPIKTGAFDDEPMPEAIGGFRLLRRLGSGGMGAVYEAEEASTGRHVALKLIAQEFAESEGAVERFRQEGRLASVISHSRCVFVLAADEDAGRPYIVMELMPGSTLRDLVEKKGPLPQEEAVAKIMDVVDGLREAHQLGVIHRDVKPSNCFLETDGRVKIGDFGLSKSLMSDSNLTRTGAFLGTPQFASPEQIRRDPLDQQTDVYSVAATLYFLLTGRAPHETNDASATMARIVADPAPPVRSHRPEISSALDRVILRGLERQRDRRWRSLDEFRTALLPFVPGQLSIGGMGMRFGAYLIDYVLLFVVTFFINFLWVWATGVNFMAPENALRYQPNLLIVPAAWIGYFSLLEGWWGCSLGKRLLRLRVTGGRGSDSPGLLIAAARSIPFYFFLHLGSLPAFFIPLLVKEMPPDDVNFVMSREMIILMAAGCSYYPLTLLGILLLVGTMRARNGYRGLHEFMSGTRVVSLPEAAKRRSLPNRLGEGLEVRPDLPERVGPFEVRGLLKRENDSLVLLGEDVGLKRKVVIWLRPAAAPPLGPARSGISRATRWRWLGNGQLGEQSWEAFLTLPGCSLPELISSRGPLPWPEARPLLEQLTDELTLACTDGTLPQSLTVGQVWVQTNGLVQLLDVPLRLHETSANDSPHLNTDALRALTLLQEAAILSLEGKPRKEGATDPPIRAPVPEHMIPYLDRLLVGRRDDQIQRFQADLADTHDKPSEVTRGRRFAHLVVLTGFLSLGLFGCMIPASVWPGYLTATMNYSSIQGTEFILKELDQGALSDYFCSGLDPNPLVRAKAVIQFREDLLLREQLQQRLEKLRQEQNVYRQSLGQGTRAWVVLGEQYSREGQQGMGPSMRRQAMLQQGGFRPVARQTLQFSFQTRNFARVLEIMLLVNLLVWPVLWVLWAFAWRGGLSFRLLGLSLVRSDGQPASRFQCAWRMVLVLLPVMILLGLSGWLEVYYWMNLDVESLTGSSWILWLSTAAWWAALLLLLTYFILAVWSPSRTLLDRMAGTYLVPR